MNMNDVSKREILDFDKFRAKVHDSDFKPLSKENQASAGEGKSGLHNIKRQPAYDFVGYADAIFNPEKAGIEVPGYNPNGDREYINGIGGKGSQGSIATMEVTENEITESEINEEPIDESQDNLIIRLKDF